MSESDAPALVPTPASAPAPATPLQSDHTPDLALLIIDPQIDFLPGGACAIPNAESASLRIAELLAAKGAQISQLYVSLDAHHRTHIANPTYWQHAETGEAPPNWTVISAGDVEDDVWRPRVASNLPKALWYTQQLETQSKPSLLVWPEHCLLGTRGGSCSKIVNDAIQEWAAQHPSARVEYIVKVCHVRVLAVAVILRVILACR